MLRPMIIDEMRAVQDRVGWLPGEELKKLSEKLNIPVYHLHGVASFYPHFRLQPPPRATVHVCTDIACHLRGADRLLNEIKVKAQDKDDVEVKGCSCLGQCDRAPAALIDDRPYAGQGASGILELANRVIEGESIIHLHFPSAAQGPFRTDPYTSETERYSVIKQLVASGDYAGVVTKIKDANLRGMGGGGFGSWRKWDTVRNQPPGEKFIICNFDEAEVGTFKDREIVKNLPYLLVESMAIAGLTVGAERGFIYIRHEYHEQYEILKKEIARAKHAGILGANAAGSGKTFELEIFVSPGGYVQGEETALMEAIEGNRGQPRLKPTIPAIHGLWGRPTLINNVETFVYVPVILAKGPDWFKAQGKNGAQGLKWVGVGGHVNKPGVFEVSMGTTYTEVIEMAGGVSRGKKLKAFSPSGPSFGIVPAKWADTPMDFPDGKNAISQVGKLGPDDKQAPIGTTVGSAAIVIYAEGTDLVDAALNFTKFYRNESCGKCVPCRSGSQKLVDIISGITAGTVTDDDLGAIDRLAFTLDMTSICGLGQVVSTPIKWVMKHFRNEVDEYLAKRKPLEQKPVPEPATAGTGGAI